MNAQAESPLIVIVGPTASGKTSLAVKLAKEFGGEIICADSRTIYKGMDIGTAKPTPEEQASVPHWGLDLVEPGGRYTAADFKDYAYMKIEEIRKRGNIPFLVGGTGLYIDSVVFDYKFSTEPDSRRRAELEKEDIKTLQKYCIKNNITLPENVNNKRYVIRAIEQKGVNQQRQIEPIADTIIVGISTDKNILRTRICARSEQLFNNGMIEEAIELGRKYGWNSEAMTGNIYPLVRQYIQKELTYDDLKTAFATADWRLAKRQLTWLKRNSFIQWESLDGAYTYLHERLANHTR